VTRRLRLTHFRDVNIGDPFFDSLKAGYAGFAEWFARKSDEELYVVEDGSTLSGMIYLKSEDGPIIDVEPELPAGKWLKVGTLKIQGRGTKLGERVLKKILDTAIARNLDGVYITVFELHTKLISLFERYGFQRFATKTTSDGIELVLARRLADTTGDIIRDYPLLHTRGMKFWLLAIYPDYHTQLLPDSILRNEPEEIVRDVSHTNTIHKAYIARVPLTRMSRGDLVIFYRTTDHKAPAYYRSVATSVCVIEEVRRKSDFGSVDTFVAYARPHSVFSDEELRDQYVTSNRLYIAKMTYNAAFGRRITRGTLLDEVHIPEHPRWDLKELTRQQFEAVLEIGNVNERIVVD
jgi:hypothetical protein